FLRTNADLSASSPAPHAEALGECAFASAEPRSTHGAGAGSERRRHFLDDVTLDLVALADVLVVLEGHAAFEPGLDLAHFVLEALQGRKLTLVDDDVVAQEAHPAAALDDALGDLAAGDVADLADLEHLEDLGVADEALALHRCQQALHQLLHVVGDVVDDR